MWIDCSNKECTINIDYIVEVYIDGRTIIGELADGKKIELGIYENFDAAEAQFKLWKSALINGKTFFRF